MAKLTIAEKAQSLALTGEVTPALELFRSLQLEGDVGANASLAEFAAFGADWPQVLQLVEKVFEKPVAVRTMNVFADMCMLVATAGINLSEWSEIQRLAKFALSKLSKKPADEGNIESARNLKKFADSKGSKPMIEISESEIQRKAHFEAALLKNSQKKFKSPAGRLDHLFGLARNYDYYPGAVALFDRESDLPNLFDNAIFAASALARIGREKEAWAAVKSAVPRWWPVEVTQVVPVIIVTDDAIRELMTPARRKEILRTPRGPGVSK